MSVSHANTVRRLRGIRARLRCPVSEGGPGLDVAGAGTGSGVFPQTMPQYCLVPTADGARRLPETRLERPPRIDKKG